MTPRARVSSGLARAGLRSTLSCSFQSVGLTIDDIRLLRRGNTSWKGEDAHAGPHARRRSVRRAHGNLLHVASRQPCHRRSRTWHIRSRDRRAVRRTSKSWDHLREHDSRSQRPTVTREGHIGAAISGGCLPERPGCRPGTPTGATGHPTAQLMVPTVIKGSDGCPVSPMAKRTPDRSSCTTRTTVRDRR
jgi:hypothetical protein